MSWNPTTDEDFTMSPTADAVYAAMEEYEAGESDVSGYAKDDEDLKLFSVVVAVGPTDVVAVHVDWKAQKVVTAWRVDGHTP